MWAPAWLPFGLHGGVLGFASWLFWLPRFYYGLWTQFSGVLVPVRARGMRAACARARACALSVAAQEGHPRAPRAHAHAAACACR
jgi:hypothetical protein